MTMRKCLKCKKLKPRDSYYTSGGYPQSYCKPCQNAFAKEWRDKNKSHMKEYKRKKWAETPNRKKTDAHLRFRYGITIDAYEEKHDAQYAMCAICQEPENGKRLGVDHCHDTGKVRALLCDRCNTLIGRVKDSSAILRNAATYLDFWTAK
jgi:hypothetical protein